MTEVDRVLLKALTDGCDKFCLSLGGNRLSREEHIEMALIFIDMAERILGRVLDRSAVVEDEAT